MGMEIFLENKYRRWYHSLVERGRVRALDENSYRENHHIVPESFYINRSRSGPAGWLDGDPEAPENKVDLTGREHGLAHWLLTKMTTGVALIKCQQAFDMMGIGAAHQERGMSRLTCRAFAANREAVAKIRSERMIVDNVARMPGVGEKIAESKRGKKRGPQSAEWLAKLTATRQGDRNGMSGRTHRESSKDIQREKAEQMMWVNDGTTSKRIYKHDAQPYLDSGWSKGRHYVKRGPRGPYKKKSQ